MTSTDTFAAGTLFPARREWEVTEWRDRSVKAAGYRLTAGGRARPFGNTGCDRPILTVEQIETQVTDGHLIPAAVSALPPLLREVQRFRTVSEYLVGDDACLEGDCDHHDENDEPTGECVLYRGLATAEESGQLRTIRRLLDAHLDTGATAGDPNELDELRRLVAEIHDVYLPDPQRTNT